MTNVDATTFFNYPDNGNTSAYAVDAMKWATDLGIINGSDGLLLPLSVASRAQVAQIIKNFAEIVLAD